MRGAQVAVLVVAAVSATLAGLLAAPAGASKLIARNATDVSFGVSADGTAVVTYKADGKLWHLLAWGAVNATAPTTARPQVTFQLAYDGGYQKLYKDNPEAKAAVAELRDLQKQIADATKANDNPLRYELKPKIAAAFAKLETLRDAATNYWKTFENACAPYDGPPLAWLVSACKAPDGSYWALQSWQRALPDYGIEPTPAQATWELRLSHWTGDLPQLEARLDWVFRGRYEHLFGTFQYRGTGVYGFGSTSHGAPLDTYGRNIYLDTLDSAHGSGWKRENSFLTHRPDGTFCYGFFPHGLRPAGNGLRYRATVIGPGVSPDVMWEGVPPGPYDPEADLVANAEQSLLGDKICSSN